MTNQYFLARLTGRDPNLRAGDADRERIADRLRKGHTEGRLDMTEFQERLERCYEAKTFGQLDELIRDLPREPEVIAPRSRGSRWQGRLAGLAPLLIILIILGAASGHHHVFWSWIVVLFVLWRIRSWQRRRWFAGGQRGPGEWI